MVILWTNNEFIPQQWWVDVGFVSSMWDNLGHVWLNLNRGVGLLFFWEILQPNIEWHIWSLELSLFCGLVLGGPPFEKKDAACRVQRGPYEIMNSSPVSKFQECNLQHLWVSKKKNTINDGKTLLDGFWSWSFELRNSSDDNKSPRGWTCRCHLRRWIQRCAKARTIEILEADVSLSWKRERKLFKGLLRFLEALLYRSVALVYNYRGSFTNV